MMTRRQCRTLATKYFNWHNWRDPYGVAEIDRELIVGSTTDNLMQDPQGYVLEMVDELLQCAEEDEKDIKDPEYSDILNSLFCFLDKANRYGMEVD